jgi:hypothetical protein
VAEGCRELLRLAGYGFIRAVRVGEDDFSLPDRPGDTEFFAYLIERLCDGDVRRFYGKGGHESIRTASILERGACAFLFEKVSVPDSAPNELKAFDSGGLFEIDARDQNTANRFLQEFGWGIVPVLREQTAGEDEEESN